MHVMFLLLLLFLIINDLIAVFAVFLLSAFDVLAYLVILTCDWLRTIIYMFSKLNEN